MMKNYAFILCTISAAFWLAAASPAWASNGDWAALPTTSAAETETALGLTSFTNNDEYSTILNITGGPPAAVGYGNEIPAINITIEAIACENTADYITAVVSMDKGQSSTQTEYIFNGDDNKKVQTTWHGGPAFNDYFDMSFGPFKAPAATDLKRAGVTYAQDPNFNINFDLDAVVDSDSGSGTITANGIWVVNLLSPPKSVTITATAQPKSGYGAWFKPATATATVTIPSK
jgi:hypothetical protein